MSHLGPRSHTPRPTASTPSTLAKTDIPTTSSLAAPRKLGRVSRIGIGLVAVTSVCGALTVGLLANPAQAQATAQTAAGTSTAGTAASAVASVASRGSLPVGKAQYPVPAGALFVSSTTGNDAAAGLPATPKRTVAAAIKAAHAGQTIVVRGGSYHESLSVPAVLTGLTIQAYPGEAVWFDGSMPVTNWTKQGSTWVATGWTAQFDHSASFTTGSNAGGFVLAAHPMAAWPDQTFIDGAKLRQVASAAQVVPGTFFVDYAAHTLTIGSDPTGHQVSASSLSTALTVSAPGMTFRGVGVRRYANSLPKGGAIYFARPGDAIANVVVTDMATQGISMYKSDTVVDHVTVVRSGMLGITGYHADNSIIENSIITKSNSEYFNKAPSSAGIKVVASANIVIRNNQVSDGYDTHGIWTDGSVIGFDIVGNDVKNAGNAPAIQVEESAQGIVADNIVSGSTTGVYVFDTSDVKIFNNNFSGNATGSVFLLQDARRAANYGAANPNCTWVIDNIQVSNNRFGYNGGPYGFQFYALDGATGIPASSMHITLTGNLFHTRTAAYDSMIGWGGSNAKITHYESPSALNAALGVAWQNAQSTTSTLSPALQSDSATGTVPLPSDVAAAVGQPTGTQHLGSFHS